ncbi:GNAT family N-acetyltransferase [Phenylobacterium sp.]|uniref:GNAT family N-acetyltransferase n=1 Tax=Phenylobacterium sp. TaxID=1871053 RepID=UPI0030012803
MLTTSRLCLRPWLEADRPAFAAMHADPEVMVDAGRPLTREKSDRKFDRYRAAHDQLGFGHWAVETLAGDWLGYCGVMPSKAGHVLGEHLSAGWRLKRSAWGSGYATEAADAALADIFDRRLADEVLAYTAPDNLRSQAVMDRLALRRDPARDFSMDDGRRLWTGLVWVAAPQRPQRTSI